MTCFTCRSITRTALAACFSVAASVAATAADPAAPVEPHDFIIAQPAVQQDVIFTRPAATIRPLIMLLAAPGAENGTPVPPPPAVEIPPPPAEPAAPPQPAGPGAPVRGPFFQRFVPSGTVQFVTPAGIAENGKFWLGMMCLPAPEVLRSQLALPADSGLVVHEVVPDGPAAKAGILRNDILLQADGKQLADGAALGRVVNEKGTAAIEFKLLRSGKEQTLKVTPAERPAQPFTVAIPQADDHQAIEQWIGHLRQMADRPNAAAGRPLRLRILRPAQVGGTIEQRPFPADLNVKVTREGNNPVKIEVRQGDKNWQVTSEDLAKLPETIRPFIEGMVGNMAAGRTTAKAGVVEAFPVPEVEFQPGSKVEVEGAPAVAPTITVAPLPAPATAPAPPAPAPSASPAQPNRGAEINQLRDQLKDLQRRLDQLGNEKK